jgi:hypothetical protein
MRPPPPRHEGMRISSPTFRPEIGRRDLGQAGLHVDHGAVLIEHAHLDGSFQLLDTAHRRATSVLSCLATAA